MRIGLIAEGSYPYISGGVSSWIQMLIESMPDQEFEIISLSEKERNEQDRRYQIPANVTGITDINLNGKKQSMKPSAQLTDHDKLKLEQWILYNKINEHALAVLGNADKVGTAEQFFNSPFFWEMMESSYQLENGMHSFIAYISMWKSQLTPIIHLLQQPFPNVDIIHSVSTGYAGLVAAYLKITRNIPFILTEHGIYGREREEEILQAGWIPHDFKKQWIRFFYQLSSSAYDHADDVITLFQKNSDFQRHLGAPAEKLKVIPNGVDFHKYAALAKQDSGTKLRIGAIIRVVPIKDIKTMILSASYLKEENIPFEFLIMGPTEEDEEYASECQNLIDILGLEKEVFLTGRINIVDMLASLDVCVLSSISEGQPLAVLEGMAAGIPWVTTDVGCCTELIHGGRSDRFGQAGFVVPPVNPKAMAEKLKWYYENPEEGIRFGLNGQNRVEAFYQISQVTEAYSVIYHERGEASGRNRVSSSAVI
ncbi:GT4 family glycosyltransferase PelF [Bacillus salacetis]|uniref:GT4 family glycosyltransferase PelF n=1 Tax=Bacillus salacetis TaxID=2315464 RepID=UPI003BA23624